MRRTYKVTTWNWWNCTYPKRNLESICHELSSIKSACVESGNLLGRLGREPHRVRLVSLRSGLSKGKGERIWAPAHTGYFLVSDYLPETTSNSSHFILDGGRSREVRIFVCTIFLTPCQCKKLAAGRLSDYSLVKYYFEIFAKTSEDNWYIHGKRLDPKRS